MSVNENTEKIPDAELEVMKVVWANESPISSTFIQSILNREREWLLTSINTLLSRLAVRSFVSSEKVGKNRLYIPLVKESEYIAFENKQFLKKVNDNSVKKFLTSLYDNNALTKQDIEELKKFIQEKGEE